MWMGSNKTFVYSQLLSKLGSVMQTLITFASAPFRDDLWICLLKLFIDMYVKGLKKEWFEVWR